MCNIHDIAKKSVTVWILVVCLLWGYYRTRIQYLSTLLRPAQAHKHFHFPATALYFWVLGIQHPPVKKKKWIWNKGNGEVYSTENYYWGLQTWSQRTHGSKLHTASSERAKPTWAWGEEGGGEVEKAWKDRQEKGIERWGLSAVPLEAFSCATAYQRVFCESVIAARKFLFISSGKWRAARERARISFRVPLARHFSRYLSDSLLVG